MIGMIRESHEMELLTHSECFALLATVPVGRVVYSERAMPIIVPVNFSLVGSDVIVRTGRRSRLAMHAPGNVVAFEVDDFDMSSRSGWSIVLTGLIRLVRDPGELGQLDALCLPAWGATEFDRYLSLRPDVISGRRIAGVSRPTALAR
jgi:nitroimidazol reductase NimA-like FMN-containing flavoprotein (pyridoxamine 5'-phosphate oxidase superfamily)